MRHCHHLLLLLVDRGGKREGGRWQDEEEGDERNPTRTSQLSLHLLSKVDTHATHNTHTDPECDVIALQGLIMFCQVFQFLLVARFFGF
ncbi:hypothetical protein J4Q44_G00283530, partial [Coregonus suidteri]